MNYLENEIKILDVDCKDECAKLETMGAKKVFEGERVFTTFDTSDYQYLKKDTLIRLTEEDKLKLSVSTNNSKSSTGEKETVKLFVSRKKEMVDFFSKISIFPICEVKTYRVSYELETSKGIVDFDLDTFPLISPFLEIDLDCLDCPLDDLLSQLDLQTHQYVNFGTEKIYEMNHIDYYKQFQIEAN